MSVQCYKKYDYFINGVVCFINGLFYTISGAFFISGFAIWVSQCKKRQELKYIKNPPNQKFGGFLFYRN